MRASSPPYEFNMIDIAKLLLELEMQVERQELRKLGLSEEEIDASFEFEYDTGSWYDDEATHSPEESN